MFSRIHLWSHLVLDFCSWELFFFIPCSISLLVSSSYFIFLPDSVLGDCTFLEIYQFLLGCPFYWHKSVHSNLLWSFVFLWYLLFPFWFYLFGSSLSLSFSDEPSLRFINFIFSKKQLLVLLIFATVFFMSIYFCSDLYDFLPSTDFGFSLFFFL